MTLFFVLAAGFIGYWLLTMLLRLTRYSASMQEASASAKKPVWLLALAASLAFLLVDSSHGVFGCLVLAVVLFPDWSGSAS